MHMHAHRGLIVLLFVRHTYLFLFFCLANMYFDVIRHACEAYIAIYVVLPLLFIFKVGYHTVYTFPPHLGLG